MIEVSRWHLAAQAHSSMSGLGLEMLKRAKGRGIRIIMISRHWKGTVRPGQADSYVRHLQRDTFPELAAIPGFIRASILRREVEAGTEFQVVTIWESLSAARAFAGADMEAAVVPPAVAAMMVHYDQRVVHYEIADTYLP